MAYVTFAWYAPRDRITYTHHMAINKKWHEELHIFTLLVKYPYLHKLLTYDAQTT